MRGDPSPWKPGSEVLPAGGGGSKATLPWPGWEAVWCWGGGGGLRRAVAGTQLPWPLSPCAFPWPALDFESCEEGIRASLPAPHRPGVTGNSKMIIRACGTEMMSEPVHRARFPFVPKRLGRGGIRSPSPGCTGP